jgi:hypothetical protein
MLVIEMICEDPSEFEEQQKKHHGITCDASLLFNCSA